MGAAMAREKAPPMDRLVASGAMGILSAWQQVSPQPLWLVDPDRLTPEEYARRAEAYYEAGGQWVLVGGSFLAQADMSAWCREAKALFPSLALVLFPGSVAQLTPAVDAVLLLFLASSRNPYYLIGAQVEAAPILYRWGGEVIPTTYLLVGMPEDWRTVHYITQSLPIPADKPELVQATALAGLLLGQKVIYIDAGSGAAHALSPEAVSAVRAITTAPLLVGGGVYSPETAQVLLQAGATFVVIGTAAEKKPFSRTAWQEFFSLCTS
ncbi:MAG: geranylgeranylglyceryl/heptaprenylglyceryl phosphate synthase [Bacteroidia bacterium]|nr:MAG: geranylgeranylglyceryl/heptaprenylglyceryl phosphate synthase [Bacteroidia bacterium]